MNLYDLLYMCTFGSVGGWPGVIFCLVSYTSARLVSFRIIYSALKSAFGGVHVKGGHFLS